MNLKDWEATIVQILEEATREPPQTRKHSVLLAWRRKLEVPPTSLQPYQIDELIREVRRRLDNEPIV